MTNSPSSIHTNGLLRVILGKKESYLSKKEQPKLMIAKLFDRLSRTVELNRILEHT